MPDAAREPLLLDTHYWIWYQLGDQEQVGDRVRQSIESAASGGRLLLSAISVWEVGMLESKGRIRLHSPCEQWVKEALAMPGLTSAPLTWEIAVDSSRLPEPFPWGPGGPDHRRHRAEDARHIVHARPETGGLRTV